MAQTKAASKKKTSTGKTKAPASKSRQSKAAAQSAPPPPEITEESRGFSNEIAGVVFLILAVFTVISHFNTDGAFIAFFANLVKGLVGWGFWLAAPCFVLSAFILFFHRGKPVGYRVAAALLLPVLFAVMAEILMNSPAAPKEFDLKLITGELFHAGLELRSAGVVSGLIAMGMYEAFGLYGSMLILVAAFLISLILALHGGFRGLFKGARARREKLRESLAEPEPQPEAEPDAPLAELLAKQTPRRGASKIERIERTDKPAYSMDIPLGDDEEELPLTGPGVPRAQDREETAKTPKVTRVRRRSEKEEAAPRPQSSETPVQPVNPDVVEGFRKVPTPVHAVQRPVTLSTEINDPPKKAAKREDVAAEAQAVADAVALASGGEDYVFPPLSLLRTGGGSTVDARDEIELNRERLEGAIRSFGINAGIVGVIRGPTVTRYDIELEQGVKLARVTNLAGDLALALGVVNVRIAPIPDKISTVGIEVPNKIVSTVYLREILESSNFVNAKSRLSFALGKNIGGDCVVGNIAKLPHMLIAGTTGSGKSVCMNSLILSLLYKARPDEVRLIMIDPKMVELGVYNGIPHLYVPVVTDPKKAAGALQWSVVEMLKRYRAFSEVGVRDLENYNKHQLAVGEAKLPQVVIVIDELADLMLVASKEVEESICRVAQMGRAAGMHLVIATQRPSADVITGLMKANIPSRIAFAVSSAMESRIILDQGGAEKLVGMGDMLYSRSAAASPCASRAPSSRMRSARM